MRIWFVVLAALLPGTISAQSFTTRTPVSRAPSKVEISLSWGFTREKVRLQPGIINGGDWEITVGFDAARCEIYCEYHRKSPAPAAVSLPPPVTEITIYTDSAAMPTILMVDPAGLGTPVLRAGEFALRCELDRTRVHQIAFTEQRTPRPSAPPRTIARVTGQQTPSTATFSLRI